MPTRFSKPELARRRITTLIPSSDGSHSNFIKSISTLVSSRYQRITEATLKFLITTISISSAKTRINLMESGLVTTLLKLDLVTTLMNPAFVEDLKKANTPINLHQRIHNLLYVIDVINILDPTSNFCPRDDEPLVKTTRPTPELHKFPYRKKAQPSQNTRPRRELVLIHIIQPCTKLVKFLIPVRYWLSSDRNHSDPFQTLLIKYIGSNVDHRQHLEYLIASQIPVTVAITMSSCRPTNKDSSCLWNILIAIKRWLNEGEDNENKDLFKSGQRMFPILISKGLEDSFELLFHQDAEKFNSISQFLGANATT
ncbi:hypothetical protein BLNAU_2164 [Blattamonas nauphoetae]|uniref:Uncharacterized protein n=1 Tax=Blattamonas nauphoetae TaxID=2049346 RepID=A0ABQ9YG44_9EUKA|nr:hypothetical protein BLNAU_2164 [Blattamonas nauphoetae]